MSRSHSPLPPRPCHAPLAGACLLALAFTAAAQNSDTATPADMDTVHVNAYKPAQHLSSATKTDTPLLDTPQSVSVITREELDARGVQRLDEAVRYSAGVVPESGGIDNRVDDIYIRGFDVGSWSNYVTLDGMRMPKGGQWTTVQIDSWNLERVEVLKGPSAVLYGQLAPGGMINQISKTPEPHQTQQIRASVDKNGQHQTAFDLGTQTANEKLLLRLVGLYSDGATQIKYVERKHWFVAPSLTWRITDATRLTVLGLYQKEDGGSTFQFLPYQGTVVPTRYGYIKNTTFIGEPGWNVYDRETRTAGWLFEHDFNDHWKLSQSARSSHVDTLFRTTVGGTATLTNGNTLGRRAVQGIGAADGKTIDTRLEGKFDTGPLQHTVLVGTDWQETEWWHDRDRAVVSTSKIAINVFAPVYTHYDFASVLTAQSQYQGYNRQTGAYLQDQIDLGNLHLTLGGRHDRFYARQYEAISNETSVTNASATTARAGALYSFDSGIAPYLSYSESFEPVVGAYSLRDGGTIKPTTGKQWEAGLKYQPRSVDGLLTLSAYDLRQRNVVTADPSNDTTLDEDYVLQSGEQRVRGVELEGRITPLTGFSIVGAATRMQGEVTRSNDGYQGNRMIRTPDWMGSLWLDYTFQRGALSGFAVALGGRYIGETYGDLANLYRIPSYTLVDAALRYNAGRFGDTDVKLALNASNLADKRYVATCSAATACYYGSGRAVTATATFSW